MRFLFSTMEKLPNGCGLRCFTKPRSDILLTFPFQLCIVVFPICLLQPCSCCRTGIRVNLSHVFGFCLTLQLFVLLQGFIQLN